MYISVNYFDADSADQLWSRSITNIVRPRHPPHEKKKTKQRVGHYRKVLFGTSLLARISQVGGWVGGGHADDKFAVRSDRTRVENRRAKTTFCVETNDYDRAGHVSCSRSRNIRVSTTNDV